MSDPFQQYQSRGLQHEKPAIMQGEPTPEPTFESELTALINKYSKEAGSGTPDYLLASYLSDQLELFDRVAQQRASWRGERVEQIFDVKYDEKIKISALDTRGVTHEIGEAEVSIFPGETMMYGRLVGLKALFAPPVTGGNNA